MKLPIGILILGNATRVNGSGDGSFVGTDRLVGSSTSPPADWTTGTLLVLTVSESSYVLSQQSIYFMTGFFSAVLILAVLACCYHPVKKRLSRLRQLRKNRPEPAVPVRLPAPLFVRTIPLQSVLPAICGRCSPLWADRPQSDPEQYTDGIVKSHNNLGNWACIVEEDLSRKTTSILSAPPPSMATLLLSVVDETPHIRPQRPTHLALKKIPYHLGFASSIKSSPDNDLPANFVAYHNSVAHFPSPVTPPIIPPAICRGFRFIPVRNCCPSENSSLVLPSPRASSIVSTWPSSSA